MTKPKAKAPTPLTETIREAISSAQAKAIIDAELNKAINDCRVEVEAALNRHGCTIDVAMVIKPGSIIPVVNIIRKPEQGAA